LNIAQEHRYPFLDNRLWDYLPGIENFYEMNRTGKNVLRNLIAKFDPVLATIVKRPFRTNIIDSNWKDVIEHYVFNGQLHRIELFNISEVKKWFRQVIVDAVPSPIVTAQLLSLAIILEHMVYD
jgi:hypothetical protein